MDGVKKSRSMLNSKAAKAMTASCREADKCDAIIETMKAALDPLDISLQDSASAFQGSEQERAALDGAYVKQKELAKSLTALEEQMVPAGYRTEVPDDYSDLPQLNGRATVEMSFKKPDGAPFNVNGVNYPTVNLVMIIDGYVGECGVCVFRVYASVCSFCCSSQQKLTILSRYTILSYYYYY